MKRGRYQVLIDGQRALDIRELQEETDGELLHYHQVVTVAVPALHNIINTMKLKVREVT